LLHAHYVFSGLIARAQLARPIVLTHHGIEVMQGWQAPLCWLTSRLVDAVVVTSERMRDRLGLARARVIPSGVDLEMFFPRPQAEARRALSLAPEEKLVAFVGEARPEKRLELAEKAVAFLPGTRLLHVCGQPQERVELFMNAADVLVLPSDNEGSPNVVKEALACNLPVVATDVGAVPELVDGVQNCFIAEQTPEDLAAKVRMVLDCGLRSDGREKVAPLSLLNVSRRLLDVYEGVLAARR
jgi:glycosyltransferase involved in cell wall biosynthesis